MVCCRAVSNTIEPKHKTNGNWGRNEGVGGWRRKEAVEKGREEEGKKAQGKQAELLIGCCGSEWVLG